MSWHSKDINEVLKELNTSSDGLSTEEARNRLLIYGPNKLVEKKKRGPLGMLMDQFKDFMILVLIAAALVSGIIGEPSDTIAIVVIVVLNAIIGFVQEYRAEKAMEALKKMATPKAVLLRDGQPREVSSEEIVPGDIVLLEAGNIVPADLRLIEVSQLKIEEAALTGESVPVEKHTRTIKGENIPLGDRLNMAYKGTLVTYGRAKGVVVATGMHTELGKIATMLQEAKEVKTPLQRRLQVFGQRLALVVLAICAILFIVGLVRGEQPLRMFLTAVSLAVAAIPEALPAVVTISLALGAKKMVKQNALIRKLPAVETLGSVTYICTDKTGTLTLNRMNVEELWIAGKGRTRPSALKQNQFDELDILFFKSLALNNDAKEDQKGQLLGDPTETALYRVALEVGYKKEDIERELPRVGEIPFDSVRKCMTTIHKSSDGRFLSITKGALEAVLSKTEAIAGKQSLNIDEINSVSEEMARAGLRVLCIAFRWWERLPEDLTPDVVEQKLTILGLIVMMDPPRQEAKEAVQLCKQAGIRPVMITGDHPLTAETIAKMVGILEETHTKHDYILTGQQLQDMDLEDLKDRVEKIRVYARVSPEDKLKIVKALQDKGQFVAMTGDGVNDAPALKKANIGIAMGITGTDVAKEAAHMILLDDNFATIVKAVKEGRRIYDNIRKFIRYTMT
ncbi:MAG: HAD family hydrolase, partial [Nitrospirae bacterium]